MQVLQLRDLIVPRVQKLLTTRLLDRSSVFANFKVPDNSTLGQYRFAPGQTSVRYPQVANASGYYLSSADVDTITSGFRRFNLSDPEYARQLEEVYWLGFQNSTNRSSYDTGSARFWALGAGSGTVAGLWVNISIAVLPETTPLIHQARFFKLLGASFWDAAVACWRTKYRELFWRPITAIRTFHGIRPADPAWAPFLSTPAHPEYPSGHQCSSGAAVYVLEAYLGTNVTFSVVSQGAPDLGARTYASFRAAGNEAGDARLLAGVHFRKANVDGMQLGYNVARHIHRTYFASKTFADPL